VASDGTATQLAPRNAVAVFLVRKDGSLLAQQRDEHAPISPNQWGLIGGSRDEGEPPEEAALRELREETGLAPHEGLSLFFAGVRPASLGSGSTSWHVFWCPTTAGDSDIVLGEGRAIRFLSADALRNADLGTSAAFFLPLFLASPGYAACLES